MLLEIIERFTGVMNSLIQWFWNQGIIKHVSINITQQQWKAHTTTQIDGVVTDLSMTRL